MSRVRLAGFGPIAVLAVAWATLALLSQSIRSDHRTLLASLRAGTTPLDAAVIDAAIARDQQLLSFAACDMELHQDHILLLSLRTDMALAEADTEQADPWLERTQQALGASLACQPADGKVWLDFATISALRDGFTPRAAQGVAMSARVTPRESWLARKRLFFALNFQPLLDADARAVARADLATLEIGHPIRMKDVLKASGASSKEALYAMFAN